MLTRRIFLKSSGLAFVSFGAVPRALLRTVYAAEPAKRKKSFVVVFQRGACDGLNTVVPYGDGSYHSLRPTIGIPAPKGGGRDSALDLDGYFGFHPALEALLPLYKEGALAPVHAVGSPDNTRSHFDAQDFMESGTPGVKSTDDGWMNRFLVSEPAPQANPFRGVAMTPTLPRSLQGKAPALAIANIRDFLIRPAAGQAVAKGFEEMYAGAVHDVLHGTGEETFEAIDFLKKADPAQYTPAPGVTYPQGRYGESLKQIAQLLKADVGVEVAFTDVGGWDHHAGEGGVQGQLSQRLRELSNGLSAFHQDLGPRMQDVVLLTMTEFGRTARENGNRGTDHGHASVSFIMGGAVRGGKVLGKFPGLAPDRLYEGRDLALTTDFRDLVSEVLVRHMGVKDLRTVFPGFRQDPAHFPGVIRA
jgi:uncharacterized protein (DUF1501 family)